MAAKKIRVQIVDDSALVRQVLSEILNADPGIEVIAQASDPIFAMRYLEKEWPDVLILDVEMPRMDGITFLKKIMSERPTPVVICSTLTEEGTETTMQALSSGAVDIITKPQLGIKGFLEESKTRLVEAVKSAAVAKVKKLSVAQSRHPVEVSAKVSADAVLKPHAGKAMDVTTDKVIAIGASTGGTQALEAILTALPSGTPGIVIVQHMPEIFTAAFANRLNNICEIEVKEAEHWDRVIPGRAIIAQGNKHMVLKRSGAQYHVEVKDGPFVNRHRPAVDVLFRSVAKEAGKNAMGIILTGMGDDGAAGLLEMHNQNAYTIAQDEESCVVFGMPKEAIKKGGVDDIMPLSKMPQKMIDFIALRR